ncbi:MAG TPA: secondary thiamine-phosphate synthase enzyme YjbQ [Fibrobacteria bacterium]|jgi:secondary thiamine-phosphate synthase enzyme|nr:secondary thiamine-phosphate synthase enzyme YjbQ [Fibrobacteria bacterium]
MEWKTAELQVRAPRRGLHEFTREVAAELERFGMREGMLHLFIRHTSASLCISENYDPTARRDLEAFLDRLAPDGEPWHAHTLEGDDDSPSHMRSIVTGTSLSIPVGDGKMLLGRWQGIYLCEHRKHPEMRTILVRGLKAA